MMYEDIETEAVRQATRQCREEIVAAMERLRKICQENKDEGMSFAFAQRHALRICALAMSEFNAEVGYGHVVARVVPSVGLMEGARELW